MADEGSRETGLQRFKVVEIKDDIFDAPESSVLIHAVNCQGVWGFGIAETFKNKYPAAFQVYKSHCREKAKLLGTCLLIPPQLKDYESPSHRENGLGVGRKRRKVTAETPSKKHWIACLFTSYGYGKPTKSKAGKDPLRKILSNTSAALEDLREQVEVLEARQLASAQDVGVTLNASDENTGGKADGHEAVDGDQFKAVERLDVQLGPLYACKFNSGSFGVEWKDTRTLVEEAFCGSNRSMHIVSPSALKKSKGDAANA